jgi:hypothetical protein
MGRILRSFVLPVGLLLSLFAVPSSSGQKLSSATSPAPDASRSQAKLMMPMAFEANRGQAGKGTDFVARGFGYTAYLEAGHARIWLSHLPSNSAEPKYARDPELDIKLLGARKQTKLKPEDKLPGYSNYLFGSDPSKWITNVTQYAKVRYANVYPGIDVVYYGNQNRLEHDFVVRPGADANQIRLTFSGVQKTELSRDGDLVLRLSDGQVRMAKPRTYQLIGTKEVEVPSQYVVGASGISFGRPGRQIVAGNCGEMLRPRPGALLLEQKHRGDAVLMPAPSPGSLNHGRVPSGQPQRSSAEDYTLDLALARGSRAPRDFDGFGWDRSL